MMNPLLFDELPAFGQLLRHWLTAQGNAIGLADLRGGVRAAGVFHALREVARLHQHKFIV
jgi:hypothetical protein